MVLHDPHQPRRGVVSVDITACPQLHSADENVTTGLERCGDEYTLNYCFFFTSFQSDVCCVQEAYDGDERFWFESTMVVVDSTLNTESKKLCDRYLEVVDCLYFSSNHCVGKPGEINGNLQ